LVYRVLFSVGQLRAARRGQKGKRMKEEHVITVRRNGTTFTVVLKAADGAKMAFEEMMKTKIEKEAIEIMQKSYSKK